MGPVSVIVAGLVLAVLGVVAIVGPYRGNAPFVRRPRAQRVTVQWRWTRAVGFVVMVCARAHPVGGASHQHKGNDMARKPMAYPPAGGGTPFNAPVDVKAPVAKTKLTAKTRENALPRHAMHARGRNRGMK